MQGYCREKNSQAILATDLTALQKHRNLVKERSEMKNKVNSLEVQVQELRNIVNILLKERSA